MDTPLSENRSVRACAACQKYKRRCDKALPCCSLCSRLGRLCDYSTRQVENDLRARIRELEGIVSSSLADEPVSASRDFGQSTLHYQRIFLDSEIFGGTHEAILPQQSIPIPITVTHKLGDESQQAMVVSQYFETIHNWMPIISQTRLNRFVETTHARHRADYSLLLLSMKLIQEVPLSAIEAAQGPLYIITKELLFTLDMAGTLSLLKLQAMVLITVYEMGHGVFPAAYVTMGYCVTQAVALGIHKSTAPQILGPAKNWVNWEERQRVWWMIVILDRYITAGGENRPLFTEDPNQTTHLPADDGAWDRGESVPPERLFMSSSTDLSASPFARVAQAAHLLGKVIRHCNSEDPGLVTAQDDIELLYQAITALLDLLTKDTPSILRFQNAVALCLSALMKLGDQHSCDTFATEGQETLDTDKMTLARNITVRCREMRDRAVLQISSLVEILAESMQHQGSAEHILSLSPFILHCIYKAVVAQAWLGSTSSTETANKYTAGKARCMEMLRQANTRWKVAGAYLEAVEVIEHHLNLGQY